MEAKLTEFVERLKAAARENLQAVVLYGSAVTGEFQSKYSDLNILCVLDRADSAELEKLHDAIKWWVKEGRSAPLVWTFAEIDCSADVFAIELLDMKLRHRMLFGRDFLEDLDLPLDHHRLLVKHELSVGRQHLRQSILSAPAKKKSRLDIMLGSVSSFCVLFRHALPAIGQPMPGTQREAVDAVAALTGADPSSFHAALNVREGKQKEGDIDVEVALHNYLILVDVFSSEFDRRLAGR
ncbi:MAG: nucleotidyltransferase domain-containing protein [Candidatus Acidiferrales bacterium]